MAYCNTLQRTATHCNTLQHTATHCHTLQHTATQIVILYSRRFSLQRTATHCNALQRTATNYNALQGTAGHSNSFRVYCSCVAVCCIEDSAVKVGGIFWHCNTFASQYTAGLSKALQHTTTHCNTVQHAATHRNTLQLESWFRIQLTTPSNADRWARESGMWGMNFSKIPPIFSSKK